MVGARGAASVWPPPWVEGVWNPVGPERGAVIRMCLNSSSLTLRSPLR